MTDTSADLPPYRSPIAQGRPPLAVARIVWFALLASQGVYFAVAASGVVNAEQVPEEPLPLAVFVSLALSGVLASLVVPMAMRRAALRDASFPVETVPDPDAPVTLRGAAPTVSRYVDPDAARRLAMRLGFAPMLVGLAFVESIAVFGLVATMLGHDLALTTPFFVVAAVLTLLRFPTEHGFLAPVEAQTGVPFPPAPTRR